MTAYRHEEKKLERSAVPMRILYAAKPQRASRALGPALSLCELPRSRAMCFVGPVNVNAATTTSTAPPI
jgi:hypothetical protein